MSIVVAIAPYGIRASSWKPGLPAGAENCDVPGESWKQPLRPMI
ncbi:MAG: hypothetical protein WCL11_03395 [Verrucomicrobiota bacterium]|nr:hypothetical protein [Verrucomicrobiota bacterium]